MKKKDPDAGPRERRGGHDRPQVDFGNYLGRSSGNDVAFVWKPDLSFGGGAEVWVLYKLGADDGFHKAGTGVSNLQLTKLGWPAQHGTNFEEDGAVEFVKYIADNWTSDFDSSHYTAMYYFPDHNSATDDTPGMFDPGVYSVRETNHPNSATHPVAFVFRPSSLGNREVWLIVKINQTDGFIRPGRPAPSYGVASLQFEKFDSVVTTGWDLDEPTDPADKYSQFKAFATGALAIEGPLSLDLPGDFSIEDGQIVVVDLGGAFDPLTVSRTAELNLKQPGKGAKYGKGGKKKSSPL